jgi:hypothetical protein
LYAHVLEEEQMLQSYIPVITAGDQTENGKDAWLLRMSTAVQLLAGVDMLQSTLASQARDSVLDPENRMAKRFNVHSATVREYRQFLYRFPRGVVLLPDPEDASLSKRQWEAAMCRGRNFLAVMAEYDRVGVHNAVLHSFRDALTAQPALRRNLADPADDMLTDEEWRATTLYALEILFQWS